VSENIVNNFFESEEYLNFIKESEETEEEKRLRLERESLEKMQLVSSKEIQEAAEPVKVETAIEQKEIIEDVPDFFESEEYKNFIAKNPIPLDDDISFSRKFDYGAAQEPTVLTSGFRVLKAGIQSALDPNEDFEQARKRIEDARQEKIFEEYPEFKNRQEDAAVIMGRVGQGFADPVTWLIPWTKIAAAGKLASIGSAGAYGASDLALRDVALYGEVDPKMVALGGAIGLAGGSIGEVVSSYMRKNVDDVVEAIDETGKKVSKPIKIKGSTKVKELEPSKIKNAERAAKATEKSAKETVESLGVIWNRLEEIDVLRTQLNKQIKDLDTKVISESEIQDILAKGADKVGVKKRKPQIALKAKLTRLQKEKEKLDSEVLRLTNESAPIKLLDITGTALVKGFKENVLDEGMARALVQEAVRPLFGGIIGAGFGATFTDEGSDNRNLYLGAATGFMLGALQRRIQTKPFELIPKNIKEAVNDELEIEFRRSNYNILKAITAGSHAQELLAYSNPVVNYAMRMFKLQGGGLKIGMVTKDLSVEESKLAQLAIWRNQYIDMLSEYDDDVLELAGKIVNNKNLKSTKHSFLKPEDLINNNYKTAESLANQIIEYTNSFKKYAKDSGLNFQEEAEYGLTQIFKSSVFDDILDNTGKLKSGTVRYQEIRNRLGDAFKLQSKNENLIDPNITILTTKQSREIADNYLNASTTRRRNSLWSEEESDALFAGNKIKDSATDERFILNAARHFDKKRTLYNQEARASVSDLFEINPNNTLKQLTENTIPVAEFTRAFGAKGQGIKDIFRAIDIHYLRIQDPLKKLTTGKNSKVTEQEAAAQLIKDNPALSALVQQEKQKVKDSISAYFGMYKIESAPSTPEGQTVVTLLQSLLATTKLTKVAIPSLGDLLQTITNSGYNASFKSAISQWKKGGLSKEGLALEGGTKQIKGKDATRLDKFIGNNRYDNIIDREMSDIFMYGQGTSYKTQRYAMETTRKFFEFVQLGRVTRLARNFAFDAGTYRALDIAEMLGKGKKISSSLKKEIDGLGLDIDKLKYLSKFKNLEDAIEDSTAKGYLRKAGIKSAERDALVPTVGNRRLFAQTKNPTVKFLGSFLSWAQAKSSQTNALVSRVEEGDVALALRMMAALPLYYTVMNAQIFLSTNEKYKDERWNETWLQQAGETVGFAGISTYIPEKIRGMLKFQGFGTNSASQLAPVIGLIEDFIELFIKPTGALLDPEKEAIPTLVKEAADVVPFGKDIRNIVEPILEKEKEGLETREFKSTGGLVEGKDDVPFTKENPANRVDPFTGQPYSSQMEELGLNVLQEK
jgi:hypothetical protein